MATQTGNTYIAKTITDSRPIIDMVISTASVGFTSPGSSKIVSESAIAIDNLR